MPSSLEHPAAQAPFTLPDDLARVVDAAFGGARVEHVAPLLGGLSGATLLTLRVGARDYVLRRSDPSRPSHRLRADTEAECLTIASELGVAPRLHYYDAEGCVSIMDKIIPVAPGARPPGRAGRVAGALAKLHRGPTFPRGSSPAFMLRLVEDTLLARGSKGLPTDLLAAIDEVCAVTARFAETAPCHNDLNPGNVLETETAVYFVDWETAGAGDPFVDLAQLGVFSFPTPEARAALLEAYVGRAPNAEERARATLGRVMALAFYAAAFFLTTARSGGGEPAHATPLGVPELLALLGARGSAAPADVVAASLLAEMRALVASEAFDAAKRALAA